MFFPNVALDIQGFIAGGVNSIIQLPLWQKVGYAFSGVTAFAAVARGISNKIAETKASVQATADTQLQMMNREVTAAQQTVNSLVTENSQLKTELDTLKSQMAGFTDIESMMVQKQKEITDLQNQINILQRTLAEKTANPTTQIMVK